jgi:hypothetical protein
MGGLFIYGMGSIHEFTMANAAMTAVSTLRMRGPRLALRHPARVNSAISAALQPPSGPTANVIPPISASLAFC